MIDEEVCCVLYAQLNFYRKVLKSKSTYKEYFQLSKSIDGKVVKFTKDQMKNHLIEIIASNDLTSCTTAEENQTEARPVQYTERSLQVENYTVLKAKLAQKNRRSHTKSSETVKEISVFCQISQSCW